MQLASIRFAQDGSGNLQCRAGRRNFVFGFVVVVGVDGGFGLNRLFCIDLILSRLVVFIGVGGRSVLGGSSLNDND